MRLSARRRARLARQADADVAALLRRQLVDVGHPAGRTTLQLRGAATPGARGLDTPGVPPVPGGVEPCRGHRTVPSGGRGPSVRGVA